MSVKQHLPPDWRTSTLMMSKHRAKSTPIILFCRILRAPFVSNRQTNSLYSALYKNYPRSGYLSSYHYAWSLLRTENSTEDSRSSQSARHDSWHGFFFIAWQLVKDPPWPLGHPMELRKTGDIKIHFRRAPSTSCTDRHTNDFLCVDVIVMCFEDGIYSWWTVTKLKISLVVLCILLSVGLLTVGLSDKTYMLLNIWLRETRDKKAAKNIYTQVADHPADEAFSWIVTYTYSLLLNLMPWCEECS